MNPGVPMTTCRPLEDMGRVAANASSACEASSETRRPPAVPRCAVREEEPGGPLDVPHRGVLREPPPPPRHHRLHPGPPRDAEIQHQERPSRGEEEVRRLQIQVHHPRRVDEIQRRRRARRPPEHAPPRQGPSIPLPLREVLPLQELHGHEPLRPLQDARQQVDDDQRRVPERRQRSLASSAQSSRVSAPRDQELERQLPERRPVGEQRVRPPPVAEPTVPEPRDEPVAAVEEVAGLVGSERRGGFSGIRGGAHGGRKVSRGVGGERPARRRSPAALTRRGRSA